MKKIILFERKVILQKVLFLFCFLWIETNLDSKNGKNLIKWSDKSLNKKLRKLV